MLPVSVNVLVRVTFFADFTSQLTLILLVWTVVHVFAPQTILICYAVSPIAFVSGHVGVHVCFSTVVIVMVTLVAGTQNGHIAHFLVNKITGGHSIFVNVGTRGGMCKIINLSNINTRLHAVGVAWMAATFVTFVSLSAGGSNSR